MRSYKTYQLKNTAPNLSCFTEKHLLYLNSNVVGGKNMLAIGNYCDFKSSDFENGLLALRKAELTKDWLFGYITYDFKNQLEQLSSSNFDGLNFPELHFWQPKVVLEWQHDLLHAHYLPIDEAKLDEIVNKLFSHEKFVSTDSIALENRLSKAEYLSRFEALRQHILKGDIYEVNFCQEFFATNDDLNTWAVYEKLNELTQAPYSAYLKDDEHYLLCASPEQYLKREGELLLSSPIKGTVKRSESQQEDEALKHQLLSSEKEQAENVMIVDLVRNDLSKIAKKGSVEVQALFEVNTFKTVHQLISKIACQLDPQITFSEIIEATFPMGSMTGAPKIKAMELAERYENTKRGLYAGTLGYIRPNGDFEFNVVIRSLQYNAANKYLSLMVGGAITAQANAEDEYSECLLKAEALIKALQSAVIPS